MTVEFATEVARSALNVEEECKVFIRVSSIPAASVGGRESSIKVQVVRECTKNDIIKAFEDVEYSNYSICGVAGK